MPAPSLFRRILILLITLSIISTTYLYLYPVFQGCAFPSPRTSSTRAFLHTVAQHTSLQSDSTADVAPFRLLALGDPQLEGDSSLPDASLHHFPSLDNIGTHIVAARSWGARATVLRMRLQQLGSDDIPRALRLYRKRLDLLGNDYYLAHIYRTLDWWSRPTHEAVLGDLIGSQWVTDEEFGRRGQRYWGRVFRQGVRVDDEVMGLAGQEVLGADEKWRRRIINVAGNHDVGYAGDMTKERIDRFQHVFGKANWEITFRAETPDNSTNSNIHTDPNVPELRLVVLNSLNLDVPALDPSLQRQTYDFLNEVITTSRPVTNRKTATILLTHLPLHKVAGTCADGPLIAFHNPEHGAGVREQNHLSPDASTGILQGLYGMSANPDAPGSGLGRNGIILTGHDHEGCDVYHHLPITAVEGEDRTWNATRWRSAAALVRDRSIPGIREITVRSMMGDFGGNAGLLSAWFDDESGEWRFGYASCKVGVQHIWWAVHALDVLTICAVLFAGAMAAWKSSTPTTESVVTEAEMKPMALDLNGALGRGGAVVRQIDEAKAKANLTAD